MFGKEMTAILFLFDEDVSSREEPISYRNS